MHISFKTCMTVFALAAALFSSCSDKYESGLPKQMTFSREELMDKINSARKPFSTK